MVVSVFMYKLNECIFSMKRSWMVWMSTVGGRTGTRGEIFCTASSSGGRRMSSDAVSDMGTSTSPCLGTLRNLLASIQRRKNTMLWTHEAISSSYVDKTYDMSVPKLSSALCEQYLDISVRNEESQKRAFFYELAVNAGPDISSVTDLINSFQKVGLSSEEHLGLDLNSTQIRKLRQTCKPEYEGLFETVLAEAEHCIGMRFLITLRADLINYIRLHTSDALEGLSDTKVLKNLDLDLQQMLAAWFSSGILELKRITFDGTSASIIETIARKESVHPISNLDDLKQRLGKNRRCYAFFHPSLPNEPLVFIHVALLPVIAKSMVDIDKFTSSESEGQDSSCAVFYSINSTQKGLNGVELGTFLIKRVCSMLQQDNPNLSTFCTLSPMPNFRKWFEAKLFGSGKFADETFLTDIEQINIAKVLNCHENDIAPELMSALESNKWHTSSDLTALLEPILMRLAAKYLVLEKQRNRPIDPVARFHCRNGAEMYRLNWLADKSRRGMSNSFGIMINYRYSIGSIEENHLEYEQCGKISVLEGVEKWISSSNSRSKL